MASIRKALRLVLEGDWLHAGRLVVESTVGGLPVIVIVAGAGAQGESTLFAIQVKGVEEREHYQRRLCGLNVVVDEGIDEGGGIGALLSGDGGGQAEAWLLKDQTRELEAKGREFLTAGVKSLAHPVESAEIVDCARVVIVARQDGRQELTSFPGDTGILSAGIVIFAGDTFADAETLLAETVGDAVDWFLAGFTFVDGAGLAFAKFGITLRGRAGRSGILTIKRGNLANKGRLVNVASGREHAGFKEVGCAISVFITLADIFGGGTVASYTSIAHGAGVAVLALPILVGVEATGLGIAAISGAGVFVVTVDGGSGADRVAAFVVAGTFVTVVTESSKGSRDTAVLRVAGVLGARVFVIAGDGDIAHTDGRDTATTVETGLLGLAGSAVGGVDGQAEVVLSTVILAALGEYFEADAVAGFNALPAGANVGCWCIGGKDIRCRYIFLKFAAISG